MAISHDGLMKVALAGDLPSRDGETGLGTESIGRGAGFISDGPGSSFTIQRENP